MGMISLDLSEIFGRTEQIQFSDRIVRPAGGWRILRMWWQRTRQPRPAELWKQGQFRLFCRPSIFQEGGVTFSTFYYSTLDVMLFKMFLGASASYFTVDTFVFGDTCGGRHDLYTTRSTGRASAVGL